MENQKKWILECSKKLEENPNKKIILIGGASSAGKSYKCNLLKEHLQNSGYKCLVVSLDNFYKCISERIVEQTFKYFSNLQKYKQATLNIVKKYTKNKNYSEKFSEDNRRLILDELKTIMPTNDSKQVLEYMVNCLNNINFDEPDAIDFQEIIKQINNKNFLIIPNYSFKTSEKTDYQIVNKNDYDYILFEGIFALSDKITNNIENNNILKISVRSDYLTMLSRRLYRDILKNRRTRSPKETFESYFEQVMPCYYKYIEPTLNNSEIEINSVLTDEEILEKTNTTFDNQYKYQIIDKECENINLYITTKNNKPNQMIFEYKLDGKNYYDKYDFNGLLEQDNLIKILKYFKTENIKIVEKKNKKNDKEYEEIQAFAY